MGNLNRLVLAGFAAAAAVIWAVGITVLQPLSEPEGPDAYGENNTYWARELRWGTLIALVLILIVLARGAVVGALVTGVVGLVADVAFDRVDKDSGTAGLAVGAVVAALLCCVVASVARTIPRPRVLFLVAVVAAVTSGLALGTESPTDVETGLNLGSAAVSSLLALVAVAAAAVVTGPVGLRNARIVVPAGIVAGAAPWLVRVVSPQPSGGRLLAELAFIVLLVATVVAVARRPHGLSGRGYLGVLAITTGVLVVLFYPLAIVSVIVQIGAPFTRLAANPPINSADEDAVLIVLGIPIGLVLGWLLSAFTRDSAGGHPVKDQGPAGTAATENRAFGPPPRRGVMPWGDRPDREP
ncbi:hypothetical protein [Actinoplanes sp. NPDC020271]|uniref:hypothetical protein n=1 Tax=Actinoplanes sp. NPDC020271 TaxID=3363896 RepID=UPI00378D8FD4